MKLRCPACGAEAKAAIEAFMEERESDAQQD